ncbi:gpF [Escherichia phage WA45]|uniref:Capsid protein F n=1 Tax=Escherichia phage WA45 TaxID=338105 RepID=Q2LM75_9VIRU|nr:gpF [Escherichia phage WA45]AAZ49006.1 gpF [Escherichia phage WA45]
MSNVQTSAERIPHDLSHLVFDAGKIGRLKVVSWTPVVAGDSFELDMIGAIRLSPLRRGLAVDSRVDLFTFYVPHRHVYGEQWIDFMKQGVDAAPLAPVQCSRGWDSAQYLATIPSSNLKVPKFLHQGYLNIYNNYFKAPWMDDLTYANPSNMEGEDVRFGVRACNLKTIWTAPLPPDTETSHSMETETNSIDIMGLQAAYAQLHTEQERDYFMTRYRDIVNEFGGSTSYDADNRPLLVMHSEFWASGYDVDGTDQSSLGQFSGRVQQTFKHSVPRFFCPEHGTMFTLALVRFPPTHEMEMHYLVGKEDLTYTDLACDPALMANLPPREVTMQQFFHSGNANAKFKIAEGQWYRMQPDRVALPYNYLDGFPFYSAIPSDDIKQRVLVNTDNYDEVFQSMQLAHWNMQTKFNCTIYRNMPTTRDSIMTS